MIDLRALRADSARSLGELMDRFWLGAPGSDLLRQHDAVALALHTVAAACLLVDGDAQQFFLNLSRCAENGLRFQGLLRSRGLEPPAASRNVPLLAALAAGDFQRAAALAASARHTQDEAAREYEDEFLWARALQLLAAPRPDAVALGPLLVRLEALDPATYGDRASAVRALLAADAAAFEAALAGAALQYEQATEARARSFTTPVTTFGPHRFLWLEGLALLRLGERAGLAVELELRFCPRLARLPMTARYDGDWAIDLGGGATP